MQSEFIWSDKWTFDHDEIWFLLGNMNVLLTMDYNKFEVSIAGELPTGRIKGFRQHPICVKKENKIFCLPDTGEDLWCYHLPENTWTSISIANPENVRVKCTQAWMIQDKLYILSFGLEALIEVDMAAERVDKYYQLNKDAGGFINSGIQVRDYIYIAGSNPPRILKFHCIDKKLEIVYLNGINDILRTIAFDGGNFWLSGRRRKIYLWRESKNEVLELENIPSDFGIYNFTGKYGKLLDCEQDSVDNALFIDSVCAGEEIWFIPFQTNEIIFFNKITKESRIFPLEAESLSAEELEKQVAMNHRFLPQYVRENRYIGLYSLKNKWIYEIDCEKKQYRILKCRMNHKVEKRFANIVFKQSESMAEQEIAGLTLDDLIKFETLCDDNSRQFIQGGLKNAGTGGKIFDKVISG